MSESFTVFNTSEADRRLLLKLQHRLLGTPPASESYASQPDDRTATLVMALAPMAFAFLYLMILNFFIFR